MTDTAGHPNAADVLAAVRVLQPSATTRAVAEWIGWPTTPYGLRIMRETLFAMHMVGAINAPSGRPHHWHATPFWVKL